MREEERGERTCVKRIEWVSQSERNCRVDRFRRTYLGGKHSLLSLTH